MPGKKKHAEFRIFFAEPEIGKTRSRMPVRFFFCGLKKRYPRRFSFLDQFPVKIELVIAEAVIDRQTQGIQFTDLHIDHNFQFIRIRALGGIAETANRFRAGIQLAEIGHRRFEVTFRPFRLARHQTRICPQSGTYRSPSSGLFCRSRDFAHYSETSERFRLLQKV